MEELKGCPFCGCDASLKVVQGWYWVRCDYCDSETGGADDKQDAIKQWNSRAPTESKEKP